MSSARFILIEGCASSHPAKCFLKPRAWSCRIAFLKHEIYWDNCVVYLSSEIKINWYYILLLRCGFFFTFIAVTYAREALIKLIKILLHIVMNHCNFYLCMALANIIIWTNSFFSRYSWQIYLGNAYFWIVCQMLDVYLDRVFLLMWTKIYRGRVNAWKNFIAIFKVVNINVISYRGMFI